MKLIKNNNIILKNYKLKDLIIMLKNSKKYNIKSREIKDIGKYPVISQEQKFISGYSDDSSLVYGHNLPVILFGDHTTIIKYVNFPFIIGADGTQVFHTVDFVNSKFLYYYMKNIINLKIKGYSRHFKDLKEKNVNLISLIEQNKIANLLSEKEQHIENIKNLISKLEKRNDYYAEKLLSGELRVRENEKGEIEFYENTEWKEVKLNNKIKLISNDFKNIKFLELSKKHNEGGTPSTDNENFYKNGNIKWATIKDIKENMYDTKIKITESGLKNSSAKMWEINTLILSTGATIGHVGIVKSPLCTKQGILGIQIKENFHYKYFYYLLKSYKSIFNRYAEGSTFLSLKKGTLEKIDFILPITKEDQIVISDLLDQFNKEKELLENLIEKETKEFEWLSEKLLSGEYIIED